MRRRGDGRAGDTGWAPLHVAPFRQDGTTYGTPTWIWSVAVDGDLYVREVAFEPVAGGINDAIDEAYRVKYNGSPYLPPMIVRRARAATMRVVSRDLEASGS